MSTLCADSRAAGRRGRHSLHQEPKQAIPYDVAYGQRTLIERMFGRLEDLLRVATRYDKLTRNFLASAILAAAAF